MTPAKFSSFMAEEITDADLTIIDGAGHMIMLEQPGNSDKRGVRIFGPIETG